MRIISSLCFQPRVSRIHNLCDAYFLQKKNSVGLGGSMQKLLGPVLREIALWPFEAETQLHTVVFVESYNETFRVPAGKVGTYYCINEGSLWHWGFWQNHFRHWTCLPPCCSNAHYWTSNNFLSTYILSNLPSLSFDHVYSISLKRASSIAEKSEERESLLPSPLLCSGHLLQWCDRQFSPPTVAPGRSTLPATQFCRLASPPNYWDPRFSPTCPCWTTSQIRLCHLLGQNHISHQLCPPRWNARPTKEVQQHRVNSICNILDYLTVQCLKTIKIAPLLRGCLDGLGTL